jgi:phage N-6-adenine-methyltransferase
LSASINDSHINKVLFSSQSEEWETPQDLFDVLDKEFHFELDVCATEENAKCPKFYTKEQDGLSQEWAKRNWMNPPYGREIDAWIATAFAEAIFGNLTVTLLPARTDTQWFHGYIYHKHEIRFINGRLKFGSSKKAAPFPSMIVIFKPHTSVLLKDQHN